MEFNYSVTLKLEHPEKLEIIGEDLEIIPKSFTRKQVLHFVELAIALAKDRPEPLKYLAFLLTEEKISGVPLFYFETIFFNALYNSPFGSIILEKELELKQLSRNPNILKENPNLVEKLKSEIIEAVENNQKECKGQQKI